MSIPAQGAVGAETMTARLNERCSYCGLLPTPASEFECVLSSCPRRAALAAPRADSDERTAGVLWSAWSEDDCDSDPRIDPMAQKVTEWFVGRWPLGADEPECRILVGAGRSAEIIARRIAEKLTSALNTDAIVARKSATPAQPAGAVPDSLRALSEAATPGPWTMVVGDDYYVESESYPPHPTHSPVVVDGGNWIAVGNRPDDFGKANAELIVAAVNRLRDEIASHPAGQSPGSGADSTSKGERPPNRPGSDKPCFFVGSTGYDAECKTCGQYTADYERQDFECPWKGIPAPDSTRTGQVGLREALARSLTKSIAGGSPDRYRIEIACPDLATMQVLRDGLVSLRDNPAAITAPHDDGFTADELREIRAAIMELGAGAIRTQKITDHQAANDLQRHCIGRIERALASRLAARPAAPEAQGLERVRHVKRGTEYEVLHRGVELQVATPSAAYGAEYVLPEGATLVIYQAKTVIFGLARKASSTMVASCPPRRPPPVREGAEMGGPHQPEALKAARREAGMVVDTVCFDKGWGFRDALIEAIAPLILLKDTALAAHQQVTAERDEARAKQRDMHRRAQKAESFRERHRGGFNYLMNGKRKERFARRAAEASLATATSELARLRAEGEAKDRRIARLEAALAPFAKAGELFGPRLSDDYDQSIYAPAAGPEFAISADHLRAARAATAREG